MDVFFEFFGRLVLIIVRNIVKDRNIVMVYDIFFFVFVGIMKIS